jgi:hypothetical protein
MGRPGDTETGHDAGEAQNDGARRRKTVPPRLRRHRMIERFVQRHEFPPAFPVKTKQVRIL